MILVALHTDLSFYFPLITGTLLSVFLISFIIYFILLYRRTRTKLDWQRERLKQELLRAEIEIKEATLQQVSQEIHDNFGQVASLIKINMLLLSQELTKENRAKVKESLDLIKQLIADMKSLSRSLKGESLQQIGWVKTIEKDVTRINELNGVHISLKLDGNLNVVTHEVQLILYRIVQEILNNLINHAQATEARLSLTYSYPWLSLHYTDNGIGFEQNNPSVYKGSGLENMALRAKQIGAQFTLKSADGQGTHIEITKKETT